MSAKVIGKGIASGISSSTGVASGIGFRNYVTNSIEQHKSLGDGAFYDPIYWCTP